MSKIIDFCNPCEVPRILGYYLERNPEVSSFAAMDAVDKVCEAIDDQMMPQDPKDVSDETFDQLDKLTETVSKRSSDDVGKMLQQFPEISRVILNCRQKVCGGRCEISERSAK